VFLPISSSAVVARLAELNYLCADLRSSLAAPGACLLVVSVDCNSPPRSRCLDTKTDSQISFGNAFDERLKKPEPLKTQPESSVLVRDVAVKDQVMICVIRFSGFSVGCSLVFMVGLIAVVWMS
jgi:hypothetical protein